MFKYVDRLVPLRHFLSFIEVRLTVEVGGVFLNLQSVSFFFKLADYCCVFLSCAASLT